jgi:hypothetical protein
MSSPERSRSARKFLDVRSIEDQCALLIAPSGKHGESRPRSSPDVEDQQHGRAAIAPLVRTVAGVLPAGILAAELDASYGAGPSDPGSA